MGQNVKRSLIDRFWVFLDLLIDRFAAILTGLQWLVHQDQDDNFVVGEK